MLWIQKASGNTAGNWPWLHLVLQSTGFSEAFEDPEYSAAACSSLSFGLVAITAAANYIWSMHYSQSFEFWNVIED